MKKILFRKLLLDYLTFFSLALISTSIVIWVFQAVNYLDIMIEDGRDYIVYVNYSLLNFPKILSKIFPFVLFFSLFYITSKYELNNELIIFWNFGVQKLQIINFIFKISVLLMIFQLLFTAYFVPKSQDVARSFLRTSTVNFFGNFIKPQKFNDTIKGVTIYAEKKDEKGNLKNLYLKREFEDKKFQITYAKKGEFSDIGNKPILILYEGATLTSQNDKITNISFSRSDFSLLNLETNTTTYKKTQEISSLKIIKCIENYFSLKKKQFNKVSKNIENCSFENIDNVFKEFYKRFIIPIYIPILSLVSLMLLILSKENSKYKKLKLTTFLFGLLVIIFSETTIRFISNHPIQNILITLIPLVLGLFLYLYFIIKFKLNYKNL